MARVGKAVALIAVLTVVTVGPWAAGAQEPPPPEKPAPLAPTIHLPLARLKPDSVIELGGDRLMTSGDGGIWVSNRAAGTVTKVDAKTNTPVGPIAAGKEPCAGLATGFGSLIVPLCGAPGLARVDLKTSAVTVIAKSMTAAMVGPVTAVNSIWMVSDAKGTLARIDPETNALVAEMPLGARALAMAFGQGALWIGTDANDLRRVSPYTLVTSDIIAVGKAPRSVAVGEGAVWTLDAVSGTVSRVDPKTNKLAMTIKLGQPLTGGQIAAGEGSIWISAPDLPLVRIDPRTNHIVQQFSGTGGGAVLLAQGALWITATPAAIWRLDPKLVEATR